MFNSRRVASLAKIFLLLVGIYLIFFRGIFIVTDEMFLYDMTESFARRGNLNDTLTYSHSSIRPSSSNELFHYDDTYEPLQPILATPLFLVAEAIPSLNLVHVVWLFNVVVVALIPLGFYDAVKTLGYDERTAWLSAVLLGAGTLLMPYSRTFFREPLMTLFVTIAIVMALKIRYVKDRWPWPEGLLLIGAFGLAIAAKGIVVLFLPVLVLLLFRAKPRDWVLLFGAGIILLVLLVLLEQSGRGGTRFAPSRIYELLVDAEWYWISESFRGYLYSPGRSFFLFSPIFLLSPWGMWLLWKRGEWRLVLGMIAVFIAFAASYGFLRTNFWAGGISIGPRYLLPLIPLYGFTIPPIIEQIRQPSFNRWLRYGVVGVMLASVGLQILYSSYNEFDYYNNIPLGIAGSGTDNWRIEWSPFVQYIKNLNVDTFDTMWRYSDWWAILVAGFLLVVVVELLAGLGRLQVFPAGRMAFSSGLLAILIAGGIYSARHDPRFESNRFDAAQLFDTLETVSRPADAVILKDEAFFVPFAGRYKYADIVVTLPISPGELYSPSHAAEVIDGTTAERAGPFIVRVYDYLAQHYERAWLVSYFGPFHTFATRPEERYLAENHYRFQEVEINESLRLVGFYLEPVPTGEPANRHAAIFGEMFALVGYDLPLGDTYRPGDVVPVSTAWTILAPIDRDYTFTIQVLNESGAVVAQHDSAPIGGFAATSTWVVGGSYRDSRGVRLPDDLPTGNYTLQTIIYYWQNQERLAVVDEVDPAASDIVILQQIAIR